MYVIFLSMINIFFASYLFVVGPSIRLSCPFTIAKLLIMYILLAQLWFSFMPIYMTFFVILCLFILVREQTERNRMILLAQMKKEMETEQLPPNEDKKD